MTKQPESRRTGAVPIGRAKGPGGRRRAKGAGPQGKTLFEVSAGGVIYRPTASGFEVCLIATKGGTRWQLPKGKRENGETLEQTAAREVLEETGLTGRVGERLSKIDLWFTWNDGDGAVRHHKLVYFYLLEYERGSTADHDDEVEDARWFDAEEAMQRLTFPNERKVVVRALEALRDRPEGRIHQRSS
ncbi:MAG TPA: NUDIX hydrolase [Candidatus Binatia bacterium]|jgi:8-oxo-dGTP pyrophosphatase MutT (NUDIX family)